MICIPLGKLCPNKFPGSQNCKEDSKEKEGNHQGKGEGNFSVCWTGMQILRSKREKNQEVKDKKDNEGRAAQNSPTFLSATAFTLQTPKSSIEQSTKKSSETPTEKETIVRPS